jgi:predicted DNA-binding transcriptional regulator AlpA
MIHPSDILSTVEVAAKIGLSHARVAQLVLLGQFPPALRRLGSAPKGAQIWRRSDVDAWVAERAAGKSYRDATLAVLRAELQRRVNDMHARGVELKPEDAPTVIRALDPALDSPSDLGRSGPPAPTRFEADRIVRWVREDGVELKGPYGKLAAEAEARGVAVPNFDVSNLDELPRMPTYETFELPNGRELLDVDYQQIRLDQLTGEQQSTLVKWQDENGRVEVGSVVDQMVARGLGAQG